MSVVVTRNIALCLRQLIVKKSAANADTLSVCVNRQSAMSSKRQNDPTPRRCWTRYAGCSFSRELTTRWLCSTPSYLHRLLQDREDVPNLRRRSATPALFRPFTKTTMAKRAFRCTAPAIWNSLPKTVLDSDTVTFFKSRLKTRLFSQAFSHTPTYGYH